MYISNNKNNVLVFGEDPAQGLDETTTIAEAKYPINFTESGRKC